MEKREESQNYGEVLIYKLKRTTMTKEKTKELEIADPKM